MFSKKVKINLNDILFPLDLNAVEVPQGICKVKNYVLISCYKTDNSKSCIIIYKNGIRTKEVVLKNKSHVGGIGYDKKTNLLFICDVNGKVSSYNFFEFIKGNLDSRKKIKTENKVCSFLTVNDNKLFVGSFNKIKRGKVNVFEIGKNKIKYNYSFKVPNKIQGLTFYNKDDVNYLLLSKSFGRKQNSKLLIYRFDLKRKNYIITKIKYKFPPMLEQIVVDGNKLLLLFESSACIYKDSCRCVTSDVISLDINNLI